MLFAGWELRIVKNCDRGLEADPKPVNNFFPSSNEKKHSRKKAHASVTATRSREFFFP